MADNSYDKLKKITDRVYAELEKSGTQLPYKDSVIKLIENYGIKLRQKDGTLHSVNISIPKTELNCIVVGLRYKKKDATYAEDLFLFESGQPIKPFYKGRLEIIFKEYVGTHKAQP